MTKAIVKTEYSLFLFDVMKYGLNEKRIDKVFTGKLKKEGAQMSLAFARRYYNVVYEAYLKQASHCVLGIMNIGLIESSGKQLDKALDRLLQKGYVGIFREGWTRILRLVQYARNAERHTYKTAFEWEKDFAESLSAEPGREWIGHDEFLIHMLMYYNTSKGKNGID